METYIINGVEVEYDTFDLEAMEILDSEVIRIRDEAEAAKDKDWGMGNYIGFLREQGESILDFFDTVLGEGSAKKIFGIRMNIRDILNGYKQFTDDVTKTRAELGGGLAGTTHSVPQTAPRVPLNREQRRAAEREQRRREAAERAARKRAEVGEA